MTRYRVRNAFVDAVQWTGANEAEVTEFARADPRGSHFSVLDDDDRAYCDDPDATAQLYEKPHSTWRLVKTGDWIVRGVTGLLFAVADDKFRQDYAPAPGTAGDGQQAPAQGRTPGQAAFATYYGRQAGAALLLDESWAMQSAESRADWDAAAEAAIASQGAYAQLRQSLADQEAENAKLSRQLGEIGAERNEFALKLDGARAEITRLRCRARDALCETEMETDAINTWLHDNDIPDLDDEVTEDEALGPWHGSGDEDGSE